MKRIEDYEIINHGIEYSDYFQGCGVSFTEFTDVATGIGNSEDEAIADALEQLAQLGWDVESNADLLADEKKASIQDIVTPYVDAIHDGAEASPDDGKYEYPYVHVSIRVR